MKHTISNSLIIFSFLLMVAGCTQNYYVTVHVPESNVIREEEKDYSSTFDFMFNLPSDAIKASDTLFYIKGAHTNPHIINAPYTPPRPFVIKPYDYDNK